MERSLVTNDQPELSEFYDGTSNLKCPRCGGDHLHQGTVTIFDRSEDDDLTSVTTVSNGLTATHLQPSYKAGNPSSRRHGLKITFSCEGCAAEAANNGRREPLIELTPAQHKGVTLIGWKFDVFG